MTRPFADKKIAAAFDHPSAARQGLLALRELIFEEAETLPQIGRLEEVLRWGQPAYITPEKKAGSSLRLGIPKQGEFALFVHCQSRLIPDYQALFGLSDQFEATRAILFNTADQIDKERHGWLIRQALTYHLKSDPSV